MSTISDARLDVAETLAAALPGLPVWAYPPSNMAAPCAFVQLGAGLEQPIADKWNAELIVTLVGPGGDNDVAIVALEKMIMDAAQAISSAHLAPVTWQTPGVLTIAGVPYFSARLTVPIDVEPTAAIAGPTDYEVIFPGVTSVGISADFTTGIKFTVSAACECTGVLYQQVGAPAVSEGWRVSIYEWASNALVAQAPAVPVEGVNRQLFAAPIALLPGVVYCAAIYNPAGTDYSYAPAWDGQAVGSGPLVIPANRTIDGLSTGSYGYGNVFPGADWNTLIGSPTPMIRA